MIKRIAVIGAGVMGRGIAEVYAAAGLEVALCDVSEPLLTSALRGIRADLALLSEEGLVPEREREAIMARVVPTTRLEEALAGAGFVTECIPEVLEAKLDLFDRVERAVSDAAIIASNTSTFPVTALARRARLPQRMIVTHFFNPAHLVPLVEVLPHPHGDDDVTSATVQLLRRVGKSPVLVRKEVPGFIANRLQAAVAREAFHLLAEGVADAEAIDAAITEGPGFRWAFIGPIMTADYGGLDTWQRVMDNLAPELCTATSAPQIVVDHVRRGALGTKSGRGIYAYEARPVEERLRERDRNFIRLLKLKRGVA